MADMKFIYTLKTGTGERRICVAPGTQERFMMSANNNYNNQYNQTFNDRVHKYTINLPLDVYKKIKQRSDAAGIYRVSIYLRAVIERELSRPDFMSREEIIFGRKESLRLASAIHRRKELDNIESGWLKKNVKRMIDILSDRQYTLFNRLEDRRT